MSLVDTLHNLTSSDASLRVEAQLTIKNIQKSKDVNGLKSLCVALTTILTVDGGTTTTQQQTPPLLPPAPEGESMCITTVGMRVYETLADCLEGGNDDGSDDEEDEDESSGNRGGGEDDPMYTFACDSDIVVDMCLAGLTQQFGDSEDDSEWTINTAASKLLQVIIQSRNEGRNEIVAKLLSFGSQRLSSPVWQVRDAAFLATGCVCSCPDDYISNLIPTIVPILLKSIDDPNLTVADSVLWALSSACENHHVALISFLEAIMAAVIPLISTPRAPGRSARALQIINNLASHCEEEVNGEDATRTNFMSPYLPSLITVVVGSIQQGSGGQSSTKTERLSAVETLTTLVGATADDCVHLLTDWTIVKDVILPRLEKLHATVEGDKDSDNHVIDSVVTACLCGTVVALCNRLRTGIAPVSATLCEALTCAAQAWESTGNGCLEDGLLAIGALFQSGAMNQGEGATNSRTQITAIVSVLVPALSSNNRGRFTAALACISDIVLAVQEDFKPHLSSIMPVLLPMLEDKHLHDDHPNNKLAVFSTVGDIGISCGLEVGDQFHSGIKSIFEAEAAKNGDDDEELMEIISEALEIMCLK